MEKKAGRSGFDGDGRFKEKYDMTWYRDFKYGIRSLWKWFPVIWRDRDWDTYFIYEVIRVKLMNQAEYIGTKDRHVRAKRDAELMQLASRLIKRCQEEFYSLEYSDYYDSNYDWLEIEDKPEWKELSIKVSSERFDEYFKKYKNQYRRVMSGEIDRFRKPVGEKDKKLIAMEISHENQDRCRKLAFRIMESRIECWWD